MSNAGGTKQILFAVLALPLLGGRALHAQTSLRTLHGTVTDRHHEPLRGAIVQVQNEATGSVVSFLTDRQGTYNFKRLSPQDDYRIWATYKGQKSRSREMSHFDSKPDKLIAFTIRLEQ